MTTQQNDTLQNIQGYSEMTEAERAMLYAIINMIIAMFYNHYNHHS